MHFTTVTALALASVACAAPIAPPSGPADLVTFQLSFNTYDPATQGSNALCLQPDAALANYTLVPCQQLPASTNLTGVADAVKQQLFVASAGSVLTHLATGLFVDIGSYTYESVDVFGDPANITVSFPITTNNSTNALTFELANKNFPIPRVRLQTKDKTRRVIYEDFVLTNQPVLETADVFPDFAWNKLVIGQAPVYDPPTSDNAKFLVQNVNDPTLCLGLRYDEADQFVLSLSSCAFARFDVFRFVDSAVADFPGKNLVQVSSQKCLNYGWSEGTDWRVSYANVQLCDQSILNSFVRYISVGPDGGHIRANPGDNQFSACLDAATFNSTAPFQSVGFTSSCTWSDSQLWKLIKV